MWDIFIIDSLIKLILVKNKYFEVWFIQIDVGIQKTNSIDLK